MTTASVRAFLSREMTARNKLGAWLMILTCPCHVVMVIFLLGGTAIGGVLAAFRAWVFLGFTLAFLVGLYLMVRKHVPDCGTDACGIDDRR
jgi:hypothetical protein